MRNRAKTMLDANACKGASQPSRHINRHVLVLLLGLFSPGPLFSPGLSGVCGAPFAIHDHGDALAHAHVSRNVPTQTQNGFGFFVFFKQQSTMLRNGDRASFRSRTGVSRSVTPGSGPVPKGRLAILFRSWNGGTFRSPFCSMVGFAYAANICAIFMQHAHS